MTSQPVMLQRLVTWFNRRTTSNAVRRIGSLPSLAIATDIGVVRAENQDRCAVLRTCSDEGKPLVIAVICDGMGGMESGSDCASKAIAAFLYYCSCSLRAPVENMLKNAVLRANEFVFESYEGRGGTTLSALCVNDEGQLIGVNVGDSRIYSLDDGHLIQMSKDDTLAGQFGNASNEFLNRNDLLLQHIGVGKEIEPHIIPIDIPKDREVKSLITSDGVHFMDDKLMASIMKNAAEPAKAVQRLIEVSKWSGGKDNASAIMISSYSQLLADRENASVGISEIWDPFGELQVFNSIPQERHQTSVSNISSIERITTNEEIIKPKENIKEKQAATKTKAKAKAKTKAKAKAKTKAKAKAKAKTRKTKDKQQEDSSVSDDKEQKKQPKAKEKPQLDIKFDVTQGE